MNSMLPPSHVARTAEDIVNEKLYFDSVGYLYRAMSWLDYFDRNNQFTALIYACVEARYGIEYLLFEEIVISTGANLSQEDYEKCLKDPTKLHKALKRITPDYEKLQEFTKIIVSLVPGFPKIIQWNPKNLLKSWGAISNYLHWCGSRNNTAESHAWLEEASAKIRGEVEPVWVNITSGKSAMMHPKDMHPEILDLWNQFKDGAVDSKGVKIRMQILKPLLESKYA